MSPHIIRLIQSHNGLEAIDYSIAVDWAINLIDQGIESDNILMLASFNYPIESVEIRPYVSAVLKELGLEELNKEAALRGKIYYHLIEILNNNTIRKNLDSLYKLSLKNDHDSGLLNFYLLHHAWDELEEIGANFYFEEADLTNIETVLKNEARKWIEQYDKQ